MKSERMYLGGMYHGGDGIVVCARWLGLCSTHYCSCTEIVSFKFCRFISVINQLDPQNFRFTKSLFHASTCFEHMCSSSGGRNCITQPLVSSH